MTVLKALIKRNVKVYFKDKGMFFSSLITPIILLVLYSTFLKKIYDDSFRTALSAAGAAVKKEIIGGCVGGELISSLLAVSCVTVAFCSNLLMIRDKTSGARQDFTVSPVNSGTLAIAYCLSTLVSTLIVNFTALIACLLYLTAQGWYLSAADVLKIILDVVLITLFGTALSSLVNSFLSTDGQASAVGTIVSAGYGFICGAYMPISNFSPALQKAFSFLPSTYGTSLLRNHAMRGVFAEMGKQGFPPEAVEKIKDSVDCNLYFFDKSVPQGAMYGVLCISILLLILLYVISSAAHTYKK